MVPARLVVAAAALALAGCTSLAMRGADPSALESATLVEACALGVPGTRTAVQRTAAGATVSFSTRPSHVDELRLRVRDQAKVNGPERHRGRGHMGEHKGARDHGLRLWALPPVRTTVEDTASGANLVVAAADPARAEEVGAAIVSRVKHIEGAGCF